MSINIDEGGGGGGGGIIGDVGGASGRRWRSKSNRSGTGRAGSSETVKWLIDGAFEINLSCP